MQKRLILGGPGSGKTERLLRIVEEEIAHGLEPHLIAFVSFTNKAVNEAKDRIIKKLGRPEKDFPFFRTLHSLCYRQIGARRDQVIKLSHLKEIGEALGVRISGKVSIDDDSRMREGDRMMFLDNLARSVRKDLYKVWQNFDWDLPWYQVRRFSDVLKSYKEKRNLLDFTDMLEIFLDRGTSAGVEVAVIDEAQDLNSIQWSVVEKMFGDCDRMYVAGDDDQAIYEWSGADVEKFLHLNEDYREVLQTSYRLPKKIFDFSSEISKRIRDRYDKRFEPKKKGGKVARYFSLDQVDLSGEGSWLLLSRNACFLKILEEACISQGISYTMRGNYSSVDPADVRAIKIYENLRKGGAANNRDANLILELLGYRNAFHRRMDEDRSYKLKDLVSSDPGIWHDAMIGLTSDKRAYYLTILKSGRRLSGDPTVHIDTIHGAKGGEADNVVLLTDLTRATEEGYEKRPDAETRVFYVGATRAKKNLYVIAPTTDRYFSL